MLTRLSPNTACIVCLHVLHDGQSVRLAALCDDDYVFLCEKGSIAADGDDPHESHELIAVCFSHVLERDPTLEIAQALPSNWGVWREGDAGPWKHIEYPADDFVPSKGQIVGLCKDDLDQHLKDIGPDGLFIMAETINRQSRKTLSPNIVCLPLWTSRELLESSIKEPQTDHPVTNISIEDLCRFSQQSLEPVNVVLNHGSLSHELIARLEDLISYFTASRTMTRSD